MSVCKICYTPEDKQFKPGLTCTACSEFYHLACMWCSCTPGDFSDDIFFEFVCANCSENKQETFSRDKSTWVNIVYLTLHHLNITAYGISNNGFFHYKTHVCSFIDRNWEVLFGKKFKKKKNWIGTMAGVLSIYSNILFRSGSVMLGESGWWRLLHSFSPAVAAHILQEIVRDKPKVRGRAQCMDKKYFIEKAIALGYKDLLVEVDKYVVEPEVPVKKRRMDSDEFSALSNTSYNDFHDSDSRNEVSEETNHEYPLPSIVKSETYSDAEINFKTFDYPSTSLIPPSDSSSMHSRPQSIANYDDSDSGSRSPYYQHLQTQAHTEQNSEEDEKPPKKDLKPKKRDLEEQPVPIKRENLFSRELNSIDMPWIQEKVSNKNLVPISEYEEVQLIKQLDSLIPKVCDLNKKAELRRFRANLALRRLKRHKRLPVFDLDKTVKILGGYFSECPKTITNDRILDRFQRSYLMDNLSGTISTSNHGVLLLSRIEPTPFQSPHSGAVLKPFIRRDQQTRPLWFQVMDELMRKVHRKDKNYVPPKHPSIDYSYLRPQHIAAVNSLCEQYFWPGIDLTEALQYPELGVVATCGRLAVGVALLVPAPRHAYLSFVAVRAHWRNKGIARFMIYHLLQTCTGKDVILHVSPTNPAIFLYQKFGFKVEELVQDFYEKYYDIDHKGCRHALLLRLIR